MTNQNPTKASEGRKKLFVKHESVFSHPNFEEIFNSFLEDEWIREATEADLEEAGYCHRRCISFLIDVFEKAYKKMWIQKIKELDKMVLAHIHPVDHPHEIRMSTSRWNEILEKLLEGDAKQVNAGLVTSEGSAVKPQKLVAKSLDKEVCEICGKNHLTQIHKNFVKQVEKTISGKQVQEGDAKK